MAAASSSSSTTSKDEQTTPTTAKDLSAEASLKQQQEDDSVLARLRGEAAKRLKDLQKAEDAADEALLRFGSNLRDFLKDAIKIAPPSEEEAAKRTEEGRNNNGVLFESKDAQGKRVIHTSRFDAQLHVIHTTHESFSREPASGQEYDAWVKEFDVDKKTEAIAADLDKYPELRATMEKLVPDQVPYAGFWKRYYFLRHGIETAEARRRDLLKGKRVNSLLNGFGWILGWFSSFSIVYGRYANKLPLIQLLLLKKKWVGMRIPQRRKILRRKRHPERTRLRQLPPRSRPRDLPRPNLPPPSTHHQAPPPLRAV